MRPMTLALPLLLLLPAGMAQAQVGGSYQRSCTGISQDGPMLSARCRGGNGQFYDTTIDVGRCRGQGVANNGGRLACGGVIGSAQPAGGGQQFGGGGYGGNDQGGYGAPPPPRPRYYQPDDDDGYAPPPPPPRRRPRYDPDQDY